METFNFSINSLLILYTAYLKVYWLISLYYFENSTLSKGFTKVRCKLRYSTANECWFEVFKWFCSCRETFKFFFMNNLAVLFFKIMKIRHEIMKYNHGLFLKKKWSALKIGSWDLEIHTHVSVLKKIFSNKLCNLFFQILENY